MSTRSSILIMDFDFFSSIGGGQVFYRRVVERNPYADFYYPSRGKDIEAKRRGELPENAHPVLFSDLTLEQFSHLSRKDLHWTTIHYMQLIIGVAVALQGRIFDAVDFPSFFPALHVARSVFSAFGITCERMAIAFLGWGSVSTRMAYSSERSAETATALEVAEKASVECADIRYTISDIDIHQDWKVELPIASIDMHDTLEEIVPRPLERSDTPPDLWFVGRLDGAKGPDIFLDIVSRVPRSLYGRVLLSGPDNDWHEGERWSQNLMKIAKALGIEAEYCGQLSDADLRSRVFGGRSIVIVPSRTDTFNYVALEAIRSGCVTLLSTKAGASAFMSNHHPKLAPPSIDPDNVEHAARALVESLQSYDRKALDLREDLENHPFQRPRQNFMQKIYGAASIRGATARSQVAGLTAALTDDFLLMHPISTRNRPERRAGTRASVVIPTFNRPQYLVQTLASLARQTARDMECIVVDDGSKDRDLVEEITSGFGSWVRLIRTENRGEATAVNRGIQEAKGDIIGILSDDDVYHPELVADVLRELDSDSSAVGTYADWSIIDISGYVLEEHRLPEFDRDLMLKGHWCLPGVGAFVRTSVARQIGGRDAGFRWVSDFDFWLRASMHGSLIHIPRIRGYWRYHENSATNSARRVEMASERIRLAGKHVVGDGLDEGGRRTIMAAAHMAAAAIIARSDDAAAFNHFASALQLDRALVNAPPENMATYPDLWPPEAQSVLDMLAMDRGSGP